MSYCVPAEIDAGREQDQAATICGQYWRDRDKSMKEVFKSAPLEITEGRKASFVASEESIDRMGDIIRVRGWELDNFRKNPVLLWGHKSEEPPIGGVNSIGIQGTKLIADVEFATKDQNPFADQIYQMVQAGYIRAVSVGFMPLEEPEIRRGKGGEFLGYEFTRQELHELSVVSVPAHQDALAYAKGLHFDTKRIFQPVVPDAIKREKLRLELELLR